MTIQRMDHVGVVFDDLDAAIAFFVELGMELDGGTTPIAGVNRVVGLDDAQVEIALVRTPDGHGRLELTKFHHPTATAAEPSEGDRRPHLTYLARSTPPPGRVDPGTHLERGAHQ